MNNPRICATIVNSDLNTIREVEPLVDLFEVRIDLIGNDWQELVKQMASAITHDQLTWLKDEMWRGSVAKAVYDRVRSQNVHWLGSADGLVFDGYTYQGSPLPRVDFPMLHKALKEIVEHARNISVNTDKWFGII